MIWLIGNKGMLGTQLAELLDNEAKLEFTGSDREVDITDAGAIEAFLADCDKNGKKITCIINCAAYTNVNKAESDIELCTKLNVEGPGLIAKAAKKWGAVLIHISTDYVFDGKADTPYTEDMKKNPTGVYGSTKAGGEDQIEANCSDFYILRTAWLYGKYGNNFVKTMLRLFEENGGAKVVCDQFGTPTYAKDLARSIAFFAKKIEKSPAEKPAFGIYHCTNMGQTNWHEFACKIAELGLKYKKISKNAQVAPCKTEEYPTPAPRPAYSVLSKEKISKVLDFSLPQWQESLENYIKNDV